MELFEVVDNQGRTLYGQGRKAKRFHVAEQDAKGKATQLNNIITADGAQLEGAPFKVKKYVAREV
jgi:hypothetical protein